MHFTKAQWILAASYLVCTSTAMAIDIEPWRTELKAAPGATLTGSIAVANDKSVPVTLDVSFRDRSVAERRDMDWIDIRTEPLQLEPGEAQFVPYTIHIPEDASGEFIGRVGFVEQQEQNPATVSIQTKISVPIYVTIQGTEQYAAEIQSLKLLSADPVRLEVTINNTGNAHLRARATCSISEKDSGIEVDHIVMNDQGFPIYPGRMNRMVCRSENTLEPGEYNIAIRMPFPDEQHVVRKTFRVRVAGE